MRPALLCLLAVACSGTPAPEPATAPAAPSPPPPEPALHAPEIQEVAILYAELRTWMAELDPMCASDKELVADICATAADICRIASSTSHGYVDRTCTEARDACCAAEEHAHGCHPPGPIRPGPPI